MTQAQWKRLAKKIDRQWLEWTGGLGLLLDRTETRIANAYVRLMYLYKRGDRTDILWQDLKSLSDSLNGGRDE